MIGIRVRSIDNDPDPVLMMIRNTGIALQIRIYHIDVNPDPAEILISIISWWGSIPGMFIYRDSDSYECDPDP